MKVFYLAHVRLDPCPDETLTVQFHSHFSLHWAEKGEEQRATSHSQDVAQSTLWFTILENDSEVTLYKEPEIGQAHLISSHTSTTNIFKHSQTTTRCREIVCRVLQSLFLQWHKQIIFSWISEIPVWITSIRKPALSHVSNWKHWISSNVKMFYSNSLNQGIRGQIRTVLNTQKGTYAVICKHHLNSLDLQKNCKTILEHADKSYILHIYKRVF